MKVGVVAASAAVD